jgi:hypothetical protein
MRKLEFIDTILMDGGSFRDEGSLGSTKSQDSRLQNGKCGKCDIVATRHVVSFRGLVGIMRHKMRSKYLSALAIIAVFLTVSVVPVLAAGPSYIVSVIIKDPSHTHGAVWLTQEGGARSHVFELNDQIKLDKDTWQVSIPLTTDITPFVPWSISLPITVWVYDLVGYPTSSHYNIYCCYYLQGDFTGTFVVCYSPDVSVGGTCPEEAVGGVAMPANTLAIVAPWLAIIGLVGCIGTVAVISRKRES